MEAIVLRPVPGRSCVSALCTLLIAAPIASGAVLGLAMLLNQSPSAIAQAHAEPAPNRAPPDLVTKAVLPSLPVPPLPKLTPRVTLPAAPSRSNTTVGLTFNGQSFAAGDGAEFQLEGVVLPDGNRRCKRLDGVELSCLDRVASRIEVLARAHPVRCQLSQSGKRASGRCYAGKIDVAEDLVKAGLARRS